MKKIALSLLAALTCISAKAGNGKSLFVTFYDGQKVEFALATTPEIAFGNDQMTVKTTQTTASYDLWKVSKFTYGNTSTDIGQVETDCKFIREGNHIIVDGTNNQISTFALDGKSVHLSPIQTGDKTLISLDELPQGIYIIKINNKSLKIARQ